MKVRLFFEGAGVAILLLIIFLWGFLSPYRMVVYHNPRPVSTIAGGLAIDLFAVSVLCAVLLALLDRYDPRHKSIVWAGILIWLALKIVEIATFFLSYYDTEILVTHRMRMAIQIVVFATVLLIWWRSRSNFQKCVQAARVGFALIGCCILWMLPQLILIAVHTPPKTLTAFAKPEIQNASSSPDRIVWILLDELSYDQVFDHRQPGINLPRLDQLKKQSVSFANVQPAGYYTDIVIPSLLLGRTLNGIRSSLRGDLYVHQAGASQWELFDPNATLFKNAQDLGWSTGVSGWFNPYCHILQGVLDSCYWQYINFFPLHLSDENSTLANTLAFSYFVHSSNAIQTVNDAHAQEYKDLMKHSLSLLQDESIRFAFIHLPVPHPPGIYDRRTNTFSRHGTYLDNLVLTDQALGTLLDTLEKTASAPHTTLIVSSDHSWRVGMWRSDIGWTKEEERASGGKFNPRPVLLIHFPGENSGKTKTAPFAELKTHELIQAMLRRELRSQADLSAWLSK
ncbi:MAG TPA: sulfatase-like hydrolase/transferase [Pseudacidobacterium sp.]|jgi:hypothetical protein|nr:sulfatase-like hydrolase/transferase [Pseudacidobacterium sp.]